MPKVRITPNLTYHPGHIGNLLAQVAPGPTLLEKDGTIVARMTDGQLEDFFRRGGSAHRVDIIPESDPHSAVAATGPAAEPEAAEEVEAAEPVRRLLSDVEIYIGTCRSQGMQDEEIIHALVSSGWKYTQAREVVVGGVPPAA